MFSFLRRQRRSGCPVDLWRSSNIVVCLDEKLTRVPDICLDTDTRHTSPIRPPMCRPPPTHHAASGMRDRTDSDTEQDEGGSSWRAHGSSEPLGSLERRRSTDEGSHRPYGIPLLSRAFEWPSPERDEPPSRYQAQFSPGAEPPLTPTTDPPGGPFLAVSHHGKRTEVLTRDGST